MICGGGGYGLAVAAGGIVGQWDKICYNLNHW